MNAEFYKDMIDDYVYYWSLKKKLISDIKSKGLRYKTINGNGVVVEKTNDSVVQEAINSEMDYVEKLGKSDLRADKDSILTGIASTDTSDTSND